MQRCVLVWMHAALRRTEGLVNLAIMEYAFVVFITKIQCTEVLLSNSAVILCLFSFNINTCNNIS